VSGTQHLGIKVNNARIERWWSLSSLAEYLEIPSDCLHAIERGELLPSDDLAEELRLWLVSDEEIDRTVRSLLSNSECDPVQSE
jgi:ribosome-binding protein aMBF1 (putative translation factor)